MFFSFQIFEDFLDVFLLLISSLISVLLHSLQLVLWPSRWSICVKISGTLEKKVYPVVECMIQGVN